MSDLAVAESAAVGTMLHPGLTGEGLLVSWRNPEQRRYMLLGLLQHRGEFTFTYYPQAKDREGFLPIFEFPDTSVVSSSESLFPFFDSRLMNPRRPDRLEWLRSLGATDAVEPYEILKHSFGRRVSDYYEMFSVPEWLGDQLRFVVPIHGWRYHPEGEQLIASGGLVPGCELLVMPEPDNSADERALQIAHPSGATLGYVSAGVLDYLDYERFTFSAVTASVLRINELRSGPHLRLVLELIFHIA